jgi:hypothetical protein
MKLIYTSFLIFFLFSCSSNDPDDSCIAYKTASIETVIPNLAVANSPNAFDVSFRVTNGCGSFFSFQENTTGNITIIQVVAKYDGCFCTQDAPLLESIYVFNQTTPGTYTLKFTKGDTTFITKTVVIQ